MSKELPENNKEKSEEVDLIVFFNLIGNTFQKLFDWISSIFKALFSVLILILAHFYKRAKWYAMAIILGLVVGIYLDRTAERLYGANMFIVTNYNSGYQVYENMNNLNQLAGDRDSLELARILNIKISDASSLRGFYIEPDIDPTEKMQLFSDFRAGLDSLARAEAKYINFVESINRFNYKTHRIGVSSINKDIYKKLNDSLPKVLSKNPYLDKLKEVGQANFISEEKTLIKQNNKTDSLVNLYLKIRTEQSNKPNTAANTGTGTNINLGNAQRNELLVNEAVLLQTKLSLEAQIREVITKRVTGEDIVSVISDFPSSGYDISKWSDDKKIRLPIITTSLLLLLFLFLDLGKFLKKRGAI